MALNLKDGGVPNETNVEHGAISDIFEYIRSIELFRYCHGLNKRVDNLILVHIQSFGLDFRLASKQYFDIVSQTHLQVIKHQIFSLSLSNDDGERVQIHLFRFCEWNLKKFSYPRSLSLDHIHFDKTISDILSEYFHLINLKLTRFYFRCAQEKILRFMNYIWSLPKLQCFYLSANSHKRLAFPTPTNCSSSIAYLSIREHRWFVQYHINTTDYDQIGYIYTLPYSFTDLDISLPIKVKSTCPNSEYYGTYDRVQHITYFTHINHLSIKLPACLKTLSIIKRAYRLKSMEISRPKNMSNEATQLEIQTLLDHIQHNLYSFKFNSWSKEQYDDSSLSEKIIPIVMRSPSIRRVNLLGCDTWFTGEQFFKLNCSPLVTHCQLLLIKIKQRKTIRAIINVMPNLRALVVRCSGVTSICRVAGLCPNIFPKIKEFYYFCGNRQNSSFVFRN
ncbi:unnamed protein product [Rotaria socialis]|uniref:Uncharacterized protein n=1 Tax=Rotaria socialis TaxID=392032 RepID=A0A817Z8D6_9BILA|nr:unnamed protein product [Rotaria socialis]